MTAVPCSALERFSSFLLLWFKVLIVVADACDLLVALATEGLERLEDVTQGDVGVLALQLVGAAALHRRGLALQRPAHAADVLK